MTIWQRIPGGRIRGDEIPPGLWVWGLVLVVTLVLDFGSLHGHTLWVLGPTNTSWGFEDLGNLETWCWVLPGPYFFVDAPETSSLALWNIWLHGRNTYDIQASNAKLCSSFLAISKVPKEKNNCLAILCDLFGMVISDLLEKLSDLQLRDQKVTAWITWWWPIFK